MAKKGTGRGNEASLLNDFSYLNMGDIDISKKGHGKNRYEAKELSTNPSSSSLRNDAFYFDGNIHFPDDDQPPHPLALTKEDFIIPDKNTAKIKMNMNSNYLGEDDEYGDDGDYFDEGDNNVVVDEEGENDKAPEMPNEFYQEIDQFLKKPPPKIHLHDDGTGGSGKKKKKKGSKSSVPSYPSDAPHLPPIYQTSSDLYQTDYNVDNIPPPNVLISEEEYLQQLEEAQLGGKRTKKKQGSSNLYQNPVNPNKNAKPRTIDHHLLKEAFAYTDQLLRDAIIEESNTVSDVDLSRQKGGRQTNSAPADLLSMKTKGIEEAYTGGGTFQKTKKKSSSNKVGVIRNLKQNKESSSSRLQIHDNDFQVNTNIQETEGPDLKRNALNYDDLVYNFQHGVTLEKLKKELQQSRNSLAQSESMIRELSNHYKRK
mmetsp:Transcript_3194/g.3462  ORF Transcript_3194/g.3462 Transcript_3194/m.3462 type:complete len:426 (-) Transcript_3194:719-1996(-)|eukprot:CAMPEP_0173149176 /NCGR_PEP_ID=MMETSP1105-20130129/10169_1 /TAXON_ID=2985 /ORGANISM="Ochromonas sp., Strain BG-1" /LENGTH=425 /DNA_ID=CAMNT_0014063991 /DNA_START=39 /DNA_END=1316 /DNA_ORIENTATION=-